MVSPIFYSYAFMIINGDYTILMYISTDTENAFIVMEIKSYVGIVWNTEIERNDSITGCFAERVFT